MPENEGPIDFGILIKGFIIFFYATIMPLVIEYVLGQYSVFAVPWIVLGRAFHELGHIFMHIILVPVLANSPMDEWSLTLLALSGFFGTCVAAVGLIWFSMFAQSRINRGKISAKMSSIASIFMLLGFVNLYFVNVTLTHLRSVVGQGLDFTTASFAMAITVEQLLTRLWIVHWATYVTVILTSLYFIFRPALVKLLWKHEAK